MTPHPSRWPGNLADNLRFYILAFTVLLSLILAAWLRLAIAGPGDQLYLTRLQQVYGLASLVFLYIALLATPLSKLFGGTAPAMRLLLFGRRAIGVSAAYFGLLHMAVAVWGQLGGLAGLDLLPPVFGWSFALGTAALVILLAMAATSFDAVITRMTFPRWKALHRLVYIAGILIVLHVWLIGTHLAYTAVQLTAFAALSLLFGLEACRLGRKLAARAMERRMVQPAGSPAARQRQQALAGRLIAAGLWLVWSLLLWLLPAAVGNYNDRHQGQHGSSEHGGAQHDE